MSVKDILQKAEELECPAVALTDSGNGHGLVEFYEKSANFSGVKPILGAEVFVAEASRFERRAGIDGREGKLVLLVKNETGWKNLVKIISIAALEGLYVNPRVDWEILEKHKEGLIVLTGSIDGLIGKTLYEKGEDYAQKMLEKIRGIFGAENLVFELIARSSERFSTFNKFITAQIEPAAENFVVSSNARYAHPDYEEAVETLHCISRNIFYNDPHRQKFAEKNWFKSWEEMAQELDWAEADLLEQARLNSLKIAESVSFEMQFSKDLLPEYAVDEGETVPQRLRKNCESQILTFFPETEKSADFSKEVQDRLDYELSIIGKMGFEAYFLIVQDFIDFARANKIAVGPGRGSAAGSIVSYLLGITTIDPLKYELLFERFLNPERISMPDIDIDFSDERRDEVLQYVIDKYGTERVSKVCTFGTLSAKAALKDVGRAQGVDYGEMNALTKLLPGTPGFKLDEAFDVIDFKTKVMANPQLQKVFDLAKKLEGCVRHVSVHACAVIIGENDLSQEVPLQWAPGTETVKITQIPYQQLEHIGLLKMDFLGLKNLSILEKTIANIEKSTGERIDLSAIPIDDAKTFVMVSKGETTGVFQFESDGMRRYLRELKPTELEDLVAMNALYRPGPMEYIPAYIKGKHKPKSVKYMHEVLEPILKKTYGIAVYQEQVLRIAQDFAGFSLGQADLLRKAIGKKIASILSEQRQKFIDGSIAKGHDKKMAIEIFDEIIVPFSGYGFNRSHAVCYARIAYETAYLRANYPVEFMAAMMTTDRNNTDRIVLEMNECASMDIEVLPPSVSESGSYFSIIKEGADKKIRFGLTAIKGLGEDTVDMIIQERAHGIFESLQYFAERIPQKLINKKTLEALAFSGAFDEFGDRGSIVESLEDLAKFAKEFQEKRDGGQMGLFGGSTDAVEFKLKASSADRKAILNWERESLGLFVSGHPLKGLEGYLEKFGTPIGQIANAVAAEAEAKEKTKAAGKGSATKPKKKITTIHGIVTNVRNINTKTGKRMAILRVEDMTGQLEIAIFPQLYEKTNGNAFKVDAFLRIEGKAEERDGKMNLIADKLKTGDLDSIRATHTGDEMTEITETSTTTLPTEALAEKIREKFEISIPAHVSKENIAQIKQLLVRNKTEKVGTNVFVVVNGKTVQIPFQINYTEELDKQIKQTLQPVVEAGDGNLVF